MSAGRTYRFRHIDGAGRRSHTGPVLARVRSATLSGVEAATIFVEVDVTPGLPSFSTVGLPDATVRESRDRVRAAIRNAGLEFPIERITVNLAPADLRKEGAAFDLPTAVGILCAIGLIKPGRLERALVVGELSLDASVRPVRGVLPVALLARRVASILPPLSLEEAIEASTVWSVAGLLGPEQGLLTTRPFRSPHHTASEAGLIGGGGVPHPGEISLAHHGVLFLDELPEFSTRVLEALRQPLEDARVVVSRAAGTVAFPARFVAARARQVARFAGTATHANARMSGRQTRRICTLPPDAARLLGLAVTRLGLSARAHDRLLRVARTIADLAAVDAIATEHVAEAIQYRTLDRAR